MRLDQEDTEFKPLTIMLETREEAQLFRNLVELGYNKVASGCRIDKVAREIREFMDSKHIEFNDEGQ